MMERINFLWDSEEVYERWKQSLGRRPKEYIRDLNLELIFDEIDSISSFIDFSYHKNLFLYPCSELSTILYRQRIIKELYENPDLFQTSKEFTFMLRDIHKKLKTVNTSYDELKKKIFLLQLFYEFICKLQDYQNKFNNLISQSSFFIRLADYLSACVNSEYMKEAARLLEDLLPRLDSLYSFNIILNKKEEHQIFSAAVFDAEAAPDTCSGCAGESFGKGLAARLSNKAERKFQERMDKELSNKQENEGSPDFSERLLALSRFILEDYDFEIPIYQDIDITALDKELQIRVINKAPELISEIDRLYEQYKDFAFYNFFDMASDLIFYISYIEFMNRYEEAGFYFSLPKPSESRQQLSIEEAYDLSLGINRYKSIKTNNLVANSCSFDEKNRIFILTGANQGGKTTFVRSIGIIQCLFQIGVYVPAKSACLSIANQVYTHFSQADEAAIGAGRFEKELGMLQNLLADIKENDIFLLNEPFTSTQRSIAVVLLVHALQELGRKKCYGGLVTHFFEIAKRLTAQPFFSLVALVKEDEGGLVRTYRIEKKPAENKSHAGDIARKCGVSYRQLTESIMSRL